MGSRIRSKPPTGIEKHETKTDPTNARLPKIKKALKKIKNKYRS